MLNKKKSLAIYLAVFALCGVVGFVITNQLISKEDDFETVIDPDPEPEPEPEPEPVIRDTIPFSYSKYFEKKKKERDGYYMVTYEIIYSGYTVDGDTIDKKETGPKEVDRRLISKIDQEPVNLDVPPKYDKSQIQKMLNNCNFHENGIRMSVTGTQDKADKALRTAEDIQERIRFRTWDRVRVIDMEWDHTTGDIKSVTVQPVYPE